MKFGFLYAAAAASLIAMATLSGANAKGLTVGGSLGSGPADLSAAVQNLDTFSLNVGTTLTPTVNLVANYTNVEDVANIGTVNVEYLPIKWNQLTPYVSAGLGYGQFDRARDSDGLVLAGAVGVDYAVTDRASVRVSYDYNYAPNVFVTKRTEYQEGFVNLGVKYKF